MKSCDKAHAMAIDRVAVELSSDTGCGLDPAEARRRLSLYGPNRLLEQKPRGLLPILGHQFASAIVWLLGIAAVLSVAMGDIPEAVAIVAVLIVNGTIGFVTELRATRSMEALARMAQVRARVRRGDGDIEIEAQDLVPGDLVVLEAGDMVAADLRLVAVANLRVDESALTGESVPVAKALPPVAEDAPIGDRASMAYKGTAITAGSGLGLVVATGMATEIGRISALVAGAEGAAPPIERRLNALGRRLGWLTLAVAVLIIGAGVIQGHSLVAMVQTGVALAVAAVPEGLPVVATLCLGRGMWRMSARNAVIRQLSSVETLGATTVILTDKTGTITENRMAAVRYLFDEDEIEVARVEGQVRFRLGGQPCDTAQEPRLAWALRIGALCSNAAWDARTATGTGDPMEVALLVAADAAGLGRPGLLGRFPERHNHAFDPSRKMMATEHDDDGRRLVAVKGAPEEVIAACTQVLGRDGARPLDAAERHAWLGRNARSAAGGLRLLALAMKHDDDGAAPYEGLTLVGLVGLLDPVRAGVPEAVAASRAAGVRVVMLTGDHAGTAEAIAQRAGLAEGALHVVEGAEVRGIVPDDRNAADQERVLAADVFARVAPETKLALVTVYQGAGHVVAMTGDGVNDAPALRKADIGVAMGRRGTQVAQEAADMVLRDDAFETIIVAMRQGRVIFDNIRRFVVYLMSCNVSEVMVVGLAVAAGLPAPLLPLQILFLNLVTDVFPAFALGLGAGDDTVMSRPPRDPAEPIVDRARWIQIGVLGAAITVATLGAFGLALGWLGLAPAQAVTVAFVTLALSQLVNVFNQRDPAAGLLRNDVMRNPFVWAALVLCLGLTAAALWLPGLSDLLDLAPPGRAGLILAAIASLVPLVLGQVWLATHGRRLLGGAGR